MPTRKNGSRPAKKASTGRAKGRTATKSTKRCGDVMTPDPVALIESETIFAAAKAMRENDIGDVIVLDDTNARVKGIVTDRDVVVRALAEGMDPERTTLASICSQDLTTVTPDDPVDKATRFMREMHVRRLPVVEDGQPVGMISMGDLAIELDRTSALAEVSAAPANT